MVPKNQQPLPFDHAHGLWQDRRTTAGRYPRCAKRVDAGSA